MVYNHIIDATTGNPDILYRGRKDFFTMKRKGLSTIITLILFLLSLVLGAIMGFMRLQRTPTPPGYVPIEKAEEETAETEDFEAHPIILEEEKTTIEETPHKEEPPRSYRIEGVGSKDRVPVDLPDRPAPKVAEEGEKPSVKLPKEIEDLGRAVKEQIDALDEATRSSVKSILESINLEELEPDKATIRPKGDGLELKLSIPVGEDL